MSVVRAYRLSQKDKPEQRTAAPEPLLRRRKAVKKMTTWNLGYIAAACRGELRGGSPNTVVTRVCTDSRQVRAGDIFFAIKGDRFEGHNFVSEAIERGAVGAVVEKKLPPLSMPIIEVENTRCALGHLAAVVRTEFDLPIVAVGGSNGKTTTKELLATVLRQKFRTLSSEASFNNEVGVPLTLLNLNASHQAAVLEVGTNHPGELAPLVQMVQPRYGIITSIGREHLEYFESIAGVAQEEGWLAELLPAYGKLFITADSEWSMVIEKRCQAEIVRVGFSKQSDWRVESVRTTASGITFRVAAPKKEFCGQYKLRLLGRHQAMNALFAVAVAAELGVEPEQIRAGLLACESPKMRLQLWECNGIQILDDSYNANADSMLTAVQTLQDFPCKGRRIAVLGDMAELGSHTTAAHEEVGRRCAELGVGQLLAIGNSARHTADAARIAGLQNAATVEDIPKALSLLNELLKPGDVVLVKGSRSAGLERLTKALRAAAGAECRNGD